MSTITNDDPTGTGMKHRWRCPAGHTSWERVNQHVWCHACARELEHNEDCDPEWTALFDTRHRKYVPFAELKDDWPDFRDVPAY